MSISRKTYKHTIENNPILFVVTVIDIGAFIDIVGVVRFDGIESVVIVPCRQILAIEMPKYFPLFYRERFPVYRRYFDIFLHRFQCIFKYKIIFMRAEKVR